MRPRAADDGYAALLEEYGHAQTAFEVAGGYAYEIRIRQVLGGLGFNEDEHDKQLAHLSGGERTRALLAQLLLQEPDLLLLDEPTNHLDLEAVEWLEDALVHWKGALVDRRARPLLPGQSRHAHLGGQLRPAGCLPRQLQRLSPPAAEMRRERQRREWEEQQEFIEKTEDFIRRNLAGQRTREAQGRRTRLERFLRDEAIERPDGDRSIRLGLTTAIRSGDLVLATKDLVVGYDRPLFACPDVEIRRGDRVALIGPNGAGKTTLLKTILEDIPALDGRVRLGASVQMGYLAQAQAGLDPDETVLDAILDIKNLPMTQARSFLGQFLFSGDDVFREIRTLSGGQRSRVALARLTLLGSNLLLLDEPTNHLDLASQEVLEDVLRQFPGTILLVSHDRYLVQALATHIWRVAGDELRVYKGNYEEYLRLRAAETEAKAEVKVEVEGGGSTSGATESDRDACAKSAASARPPRNWPSRPPPWRRRSMRSKPSSRALSTQLEAASVAGDVGRIQRLGVAYQEIDTELHQLMAEWAEMA